MKYGKQFLETLNSPGIPPEWRQQAIEYRKLKKVINRVASELKDLGLTSEVLKNLLHQQEHEAQAQQNHDHVTDDHERERRSRRRSGTIRRTDSQLGHTDNVHNSDQELDDKDQGTSTHVEAVEDEAEAWDSSEDDDGMSAAERLKAARKGKRRAKRRAKATYELAGTTESPEPRIRIVFSSASSGSETVSDSDTASLTTALFKRHVEQSSEDSSSNPRFTELNDSSEDDGSSENRVGDEGIPVVSAPTGRDVHADSESTASSQHEDGAQDFEDAGPRTNKLLKKMYGLGYSGSEDETTEDWANVGIRVEPDLRRRVSEETLRSASNASRAFRDISDPADPVLLATAVASLKVDDDDEAGNNADADDEGSRVRPLKRRRHRPRQHRKEIFIPLSTDNEFLTILAKALASLGTLHVAQKLQFTSAVELLAREVSKVSSPSRPKTDLYIWREIFSLWIEAEIFESDRERDRGERSTEEVEKKLDWFVDQVAKRKLAKRMKNKESRAALEKFISLNVQLLEMKKFQLANEEAARKILKKHDKRTALTASRRFPKFIASSSDLFAETDAPGGSNSRSLSLPGFPSLPHILLTTFTSTLLPIIPQLEDYECAICGDVAFKPIRLECGHKFCVRCLVKMQKRGQDACPQCRAPVVLRANATNLDTAMQQYLQLWFPKEVKAKAIANKKEAAQEDLEEMGFADHRCGIQ